MFHDMAQFACVSGPATPVQGLAGFRTEVEGGLCAFSGLDDVVGEDVEVLGTFSEWGEMNVKSAETKVKILAKVLVGE